MRCALGATLAGAALAGTLTGQDIEGIGWEASFIGEVFAPAAGGVTREAVYLDNLDLVLEGDLDLLLGIGRTSLRIHIQSNRGSSLSARVGDFQGASNIEAPSRWRLYELWLETNPIPARLSLLAGVIDLNAELDVIPVAGDFLNSSFGIGPEYATSGVLGPSTFPLTTLGARLKLRPGGGWYGSVAISDGSPGDPDDPERSRFALADGEGALVSWELGHARSPFHLDAETAGEGTRTAQGGRRIGRGRRIERLVTKVAVGGWWYTRRFEALRAAGEPGRSWGIYGLAEHRLLAGDGGRELVAFARLGVADPDVNRIASYAGAGLAATGPLPSRPSDVAGVGLARAWNGSAFVEASRARGMPVDGSETVLEAFYQLRLSDAIQLQPDLQWILNPGMDPTVPHALVPGLRAIVALGNP